MKKTLQEYSIRGIIRVWRKLDVGQKGLSLEEKEFYHARRKRIYPLEKRIPCWESRRFLAGFTLIELLVVIAIITLLMSMLLPTLQRVNRQAKAVTCQANLKQWGTTLGLYLEDNEGRFPGNIYNTIWILTGRSFSLANPNEPKEYHPIRTKDMLCPIATKPGSRGFKVTYSDPKGVIWYFDVKYGSTFRAWEFSEPGPPIRVSYGLNTWLFGNESSIFRSDFGFEEPRYTDIFSMRR